MKIDLLGLVAASAGRLPPGPRGPEEWDRAPPDQHRTQTVANYSPRSTTSGEVGGRWRCRPPSGSAMRHRRRYWTLARSSAPGRRRPALDCPECPDRQVADKGRSQPQRPPYKSRLPNRPTASSPLSCLRPPDGGRHWPTASCGSLWVAMPSELGCQARRGERASFVVTKTGGFIGEAYHEPKPQVE
jgi:hypothetical protein